MMHTDFLQQTLDDHRHELERRTRYAYLPERLQESTAEPSATLVLRLCCVGDDEALEQLAALDGRPLPRGRMIVAEVDGQLVAARPLEGGAVLADPFRSTAHLLPLLELRAKQLESATRRSASFWGVVRGWSRA